MTRIMITMALIPLSIALSVPIRKIPIKEKNSIGQHFHRDKEKKHKRRVCPCPELKLITFPMETTSIGKQSTCRGF